MESNTVVLQGIRYPICIVAKNGKAPSGYRKSSSNTADGANNQIAEFGQTLASDIAKRLEVIQLLQSAGISCTRQASARETASALVKGMISGEINCYHQQVKSVLQVSDNTSSSAAKSGQSTSSSSNNSTPSKKANQATANNDGSAVSSAPSETPITEQECRSDPVSMLTGEEILPLVDFTLAGNRNLIWRRLYRSSHCQQKTALGHGWRHDFMTSLTEHYQAPPKVGPKKKGTYWLEYQDEHGAKHRFEKVKPGQSSYQLSSQLALHYQTNGKQVLITPDDQHLTFKPGESAWLLEKIINDKGQSIRFVYDAKERLHFIEVNKVRGCALHYNKQGLLEKIAAYTLDSKQKRNLLTPLLAHYQYDENANLVSAINQQGEKEVYDYNAAHLLTKRTRASGFSHHFEWDSYSADAKCIKQWGDNNTYSYQFEYDLEQGITSSTDSLGNTEYFTHNAQGKLTEHTDANGNLRTYQYNKQGQKTKEIDPIGNITAFAYNEMGQLSCVTQADNEQIQFAYNKLGQRILTTLADGSTISRKYSVSGLLQSETYPDGRTAFYSYNDQGQLAQHIALDGQVVKYNWNEQGELLAKQHNDELIRYSYDALGRLNATINNAGLLTQYKYNAKGQLSETIAFNEANPEEKQHHTFEYDKAGRLVSTTNSKGDVTQQAFEGLSQPNSIIQPDGSALHLTYDKERNLTGITRDDGAHYRIGYDANENPVHVKGFDDKEQHYQYDGNNKLLSVNESNKRIVNIKRDAMGRVKSQHASVALNDTDIINNQNFYRYDAMGQMTQAHNAHSTIKQSFDKGGRLVCSEQHISHLHQVQYTFDTQGRRQTLTLPDGKVLHYSYNKAGLLSELKLIDDTQSVNAANKANTESLASSSSAVLGEGILAAFGYDNQGNIITQRMGNQSVLNQTFDVFNRLTSQVITHPQQQVYDQCSYQYDSENQLIKLSTQDKLASDIQAATDNLSSATPRTQTKAFAYNNLGQLIREVVHGENKKTTTSFQWDSFGNPLSQQVTQQIAETNYADNTSDDLTETNDLTESDTLADSGNIAESNYSAESKNSIEAVTTGDRLTQFADIDYRYDALGNQIGETGKGIKNHRTFNAFNQLIRYSNEGKITEYEYDALGRRIAKITQRSRIDYIWDNDQLLGEYQHGEYTWYINLPNQFHPVALIKKGEVYYYHLDQLNTPRFVTNNKAEVVWENQADVYGYEESEVSTTNSFTQPIRFQGQYFDVESGLHYNRYRYYSPKQQRFIHQDPIGLVGGLNHYQYAPNPVNWVDPMGLSCKEGYAIIRQFENGHPEGHFTIEVFHEDLSYATHQVITAKDHSQTTIVRAGVFNSQKEAVKESVVNLPNAVQAINTQKKMKNEELGEYNVYENSCLSHVVDILKAGEGPEYKKSPRGYYKLAKDNNFERLDN